MEITVNEIGNMELKKLTRKEALEQGYTLCGFVGHDWQNLMKVSELSEVDFGGKTIVLAERLGMGISTENDELQELIADYMESKWGDSCGDDTEEVYKTVKALDFSATADMINKSLENQIAYKLSKIVLIP